MIGRGLPSERSGLPPGPTSRLWASLVYATRPYELHRRLADRYGDPFMVNTYAGRFVVTGRPEGVRTLFSGDPDLYEPAILDALRDFVPPHSLQLLKGEVHRRERRLLSPLFAGNRMPVYSRLIADRALERFGTVQHGKAFHALPVCRALSLDVILDAVFGPRGPSFREGMSHLVLNFAHSIHPSLLFFRLLRRDFGGFGPWARFRRALAALDKYLYREIERSRTRPPQDDILGLMTNVRDDEANGLSDSEVRDELVTLVFAGHETTGIGMAWALYWIASNPDVYGRILGEVAQFGSPLHNPDAVNDRTAFRYLTAVCYESLRLNPIAVDITRRLSRDHEFLGFRLAAGTILTASPYLVHMRASSYPRPDMFLPDRFMGGRPRPESFLAFGGGSHRCLGAALALHEMKVMLATVLAQYRIRLASASRLRVTRHSIVLGPHPSFRLILEPISRAIRA